jgi:CBS domain-containing protein/gamma-glutamylcysteine synthetase
VGEQKISSQSDESQLRAFTKAVLNDLHALEKMLTGGLMEENARRIGAEQEMFLVDSSMRPAPLAMQILEDVKDSRLTTEIGQFNLEANLTPLDFKGDCLRQIENEIKDLLTEVQESANKLSGDVVLVGILPTILQTDLDYDNLTPKPRYFELDRILTELSGGTRHIQIKGLDELQITQHSAMIETCNTSFQVHFQVGASEFVRYYNWSQAVAAPVLAAAVNSPVLLGHRLWHETRLALFQHATDTRSEALQARSQPTRVNFGDNWVKDSILEVFHEDVARFRIILTREVEEDSLDILKKGGIPELSAWRLHNGTVWRWNRACYGISNGKAGLRIEARYLPSGPSVVDEMANAAFFLGLMTALPEEFDDVTKHLAFDDAKSNFFAAARYGLKSSMGWFNGKTYRTKRLILEQLLPRAKEGLKSANIDSADIDRYLEIIAQRVKTEKTGSQWVLDSLTSMDKLAKLNVRYRSLTAAIKEHQQKGDPVHTWPLAEIPAQTDWIDNYRTVEQFMSTDLFTVRPEDAIELAVNLMNWRHIRHIPVEDAQGHIVGLVSYTDLLKLLAEEPSSEIIVRDVMQKDLVTITPETPTLRALLMMRERNIGCLPVIQDEKLVGLITAHDFLTVSVRLLEERLKNIYKDENL